MVSCSSEHEHSKCIMHQPLPRFIEQTQAPLIGAMHDAATLIDGEIAQWLDRKSRAFPVLRKAFERLVNALEEIQ